MDDLYNARVARTERSGARPCEGCAYPAVTVDGDGVPLCRECADELIAHAATAACVRCGHTPKGCDRCGETHPFLGGWIDGPCCHTFSTSRPTCYELETRARGTSGARFTPFALLPTEET
jgi:hypothetical protein